jgi:hypothetical protein
MSNETSRLDVFVGGRTPAEACANCGAFTAGNVSLLVAEGSDAEPLARASACPVCVEHYGSDGVAARLWPDVCDWVPVRAMEDCQCETCTGQIEFRINAGTDFYD